MQEGNEIDQIRYKRNQIQHTTIILISLSLVSPKIGKIKRRRAEQKERATLLLFSKQK